MDKEKFKNIFSKPINEMAHDAWENETADISVYRHGKLVAIMNLSRPEDKKDTLRNKKIECLCKMNNVNFMVVDRDIVNHLDNPKTKKLFKKLIYGKQNK
ncbi:hypothetical protein ES705_39677 [subsurface metagenome]